MVHVGNVAVLFNNGLNKYVLLEWL